MTDNDKIVDERVAIIHSALQTLSRTIGNALDGNNSPSASEAAEAFNAGLSLANALLVAITELAGATADISTSVGKLVEIAERDYDMDVSMKAELKAGENAKRNFIGKPRK